MRSDRLNDYRKIADHRLPTEEEWCILSEICGLLEPFHEAQVSLEGQHYVTSSMVFPVIRHLRSDLMNLSDDKEDDDDADVKGKGLEGSKGYDKDADRID